MCENLSKNNLIQFYLQLICLHLYILLYNVYKTHTHTRIYIYELKIALYKPKPVSLFKIYWNMRFFFSCIFECEKDAGKLYTFFFL